MVVMKNTKSKSNPNPNRFQYRKYRLIYRMMLLFVGLTMIASIEYRTWTGLFWGILFLGFAQQAKKRASILKSGLDGEEYTQDLLMKLPNAYSVLSTVFLEVEGQHAEIDLLVVSPYGLFVIEVKNHSGIIYGKKSQNTWRQEKLKETKYLKNPLKQLGREIRLLDRTLKTFGIHVPIHGCVYFANVKNLVVDSKDVLMSGDKLMERITSYKTIVLKNSQIRKIKRVLR